MTDKDNNNKSISDETRYIQIRMTARLKNKITEFMNDKGIDNQTQWIINLIYKEMEYGDIIDNIIHDVDKIKTDIEKIKSVFNIED